MYPRDRKVEIIDKRRRAVKDFEFLVKPGVLGFYKSFEITQVFLIENETGNISNFYSLGCFSELENNNQTVFLTPSPITINDYYKLGILQVTLSVAEAKALFSEILQGNFSLNGNKAIVAYDFEDWAYSSIPHYNWDGPETHWPETSETPVSP